jgi:hypothetical protein
MALDGWGAGQLLNGKPEIGRLLQSGALLGI